MCITLKLYTRNCRCISSIKFYCQLNSFYHAHVYVQLHHNNFQAVRAVSVFERTERIYVVVHVHYTLPSWLWIVYPCLFGYCVSLPTLCKSSHVVYVVVKWSPLIVVKLLIFENLLVQSKQLWWIIMIGIKVSHEDDNPIPKYRYLWIWNRILIANSFSAVPQYNATTKSCHKIDPFPKLQPKTPNFVRLVFSPLSLQPDVHKRTPTSC